MLTIGIFGLGKSTTRYHLPYIFVRENLRVKTICSLTKKPLLEDTYAVHNIYFTQDSEELLQDKEIELVVICIPPETHFALAKQALAAGKT